MTPSSNSYLPGTPGGQPMTTGNVGLDMMSPVMGDGDGNWLVTDIYVNVVRAGIVRAGEEPLLGVISEVHTDGTCSVALGRDGVFHQGELEPVRPKKSDRIKIIGGDQRGLSGKLIGVDGNDGIVRLDSTFDVKILEMSSLAKLAT